MDYQQPHGYMRPPPSAADPYQRPPPPPSNHPWQYSATQFYYQPQNQHSASPPPSQWPPPSSDHIQYPPPPYPAHQPQPYPAHPHYPSPHPLQPRPPHIPQSYSQEWGSGSWSHHQSWQYPTNNNEEDWAAKARAWAAAKAVTDNQLAPSQFAPPGRPEEQNHFQDQHPQPMDPQFLDIHMSSAPISNYHQYPVAMGQPNRTGVGHSQDSQYTSSGHLSYAARDGNIAGDSIPPFLQQQKSPISPLVHQQEVPSSYSSVAGSLEAGDRYDKLFNSSVSAGSLQQHHVQQPPPAVGRAGWMEEPHHLLGSQAAESVTDLSDQPLNFSPHFSRELGRHLQPNYSHSSGGGPVRSGDPTVTMSSNYAWAPSSAPGSAYHHVPPTIPPGPQVDQPIATPSPASGHSAPMFPPGPGFQPTVPMIGAAFGVGAGVAPHPTAFPEDAYERPKKASVPNWLREEIIKNKAVITSSAPEFPKEDSQSIEEDNNEMSFRKGDQADSKSIDSSRSTEDEDEDEVEAARTAAINQEIKRVLTEVLLKVTDELFEEIATKVLKEDDQSVEVSRDNDVSNHQVLPSAPSDLTPKASAKVLISTKVKRSEYEDASGQSTSAPSGDILGLASYASDGEDEEIQSSSKRNSKESSTHHQSSSSKVLEGIIVTENGGSPEQKEDKRNYDSKLHTNGSGRKSPICDTSDHRVANIESNDTMAATESDDQHSSKRLSSIGEYELQHEISKSSNSLIENAVERKERPVENLNAKRLTTDESQIESTGKRSDKNGLENRRNSVKKDHKDLESSKERLDNKGDEEHRRREERHSRTERTDYHDNSKERGKEKGKTDEKVKRKRSCTSDGKEGTTETQREKRSSSKKDKTERRQDRAGDEKKERSRHEIGTESSRHRRRRSSSVDARARESKDNSGVSRANDSSDESSDDSKRKSHHSRKRKSPSPVRSRKRHVSRSPHSKHSKRRHSPYASLETTRGEKSPPRSRLRSRSPAHQRR